MDKGVPVQEAVPTPTCNNEEVKQNECMFSLGSPQEK